MEALSWKKTERVRSMLLAEVNALTQAGKHQAAIDLIEEQLTPEDCDPGLLKLLGRLYLITKRPKQAADCLQRSLAIQRAGRVITPDTVPEFSNVDESASSISPQINPVGLDELDYFENYASDFQALPESYAEDSPQDETDPIWYRDHLPEQSGETNSVEPENSRETLSLNRNPETKKADDKDSKPHNGPKIIYNGRPRLDRALSPAEPILSESDSGGLDDHSVVGSSPVAECSPLEDLQQEPCSETEQLAPITAEYLLNTVESEEPAIPKAEAATSYVSQTEDEEGDSEEPDSEEARDYSSGLDDWDSWDEEDQETELYDDSASGLPKSEIEIALENGGSEDFYDTNEYDYLFDIDEVLDPEQFEDTYPQETAKGLTREQRARQKAAEFLVFAGWPDSALPLVQQVFVLSGWGAARIALEREAKKGLTPDELVLAAHLKAAWSENDYYWLAFERTGSTRLSHHILSWPMALHIVRSYESLPQLEELMTLLDSEYEYWIERPQLTKAFHSFARYLWFRFAGVKGVLPPGQFFCFDFPEDLELENYSDLGISDFLGYERKKGLESYGFVLDDYRPSLAPIQTEYQEAWDTEGRETCSKG